MKAVRFNGGRGKWKEGWGGEGWRQEEEEERERDRNRLETAQPQAMSSGQIHDPCLHIKLYLN